MGAADQSVGEFLGQLAGNLSAGNASLFLTHFDRNMADYARFRDLISALLDQAEVGCSIEIIRDSGDEKRRTLDLDWILELAGKQTDAPAEHRRATVKCTIERGGRGWKVTSIEPISFFRLPAA